MNASDGSHQPPSAPVSEFLDRAVWRRAVVKAAVLLTAMLAVLWVLYASPLRQILADWRSVGARFTGVGDTARPLVFMAAVTALVAAGCPRLLLCPVGGLLFGFWGGLLWTQTATLLGSYLTFLFVRWGGREPILRRWPRLGQWHIFIGSRGVLSVMAIRQLPVASVFLNALFALSPVRHRAFLLGTLLGNLPEAIPCTLLGSSAARSTFWRGAGQAALAAILLVVLWIGMALYWKRSRAAADTARIEPGGAGEGAR